MQEKKYDYSKIERIADVEYKYSMIAVAAYIAIHLGFFDIESPTLWILATTGLSIFIWWSFRAYFVQVNDTSTAKWLRAIIGMYALFGVASLLMLLTTNLLDYLVTGKSIYYILYILQFILGLSILAFIAVCFKILFINKHHTFPLKRIALSALIFIPLYMLVTLMSNIQFIGQMGDIITSTTLHNPYLERGDGHYLYKNYLYGDELAARDFIMTPISGIFSGVSFLWNVIMMIPYYFLFSHFYKADRANEYLSQESYL